MQEDVRRVPAAVAADPLALAEQLQSPLGQQPVGLLRLLLADEDVEVFDFALGLAGVERAEGEAVQRQAVDPFVFERGEDGRGWRSSRAAMPSSVFRASSGRSCGAMPPATARKTPACPALENRLA